MKFKSVKIKLMIVLTILFLVGFGVAIALNDMINSKNFYAITEQSISSRCLRYLSYVDSYTDLMFANGNSTARTGEILYERYKNKNIPELKKELNMYLVSQVEKSPTLYGSGIWYEPDLLNNEFVGPYAYWVDGDILLSYEFSMHDFTEDQWYKTGIPKGWDRTHRRSKDQYVTPPYLYDDGHVYITIDTLMYNNKDRLIGLTSTDWTLDFLQNLFRDFTITDNSTIFFIDPLSGKHLYHKEPENVFSDYIGESWASLIPANMDSNINVIPGINIDGTFSTLYFGETGLGYILGFVVPDNEAYIRLSRLRYTNSRNLLIILVISLIILYICLQKMIFQPLFHLKQATRLFGCRDFETRLIISERNDEIGELSQDFNFMASELEKSFKELSVSRENMVILNEDLESKVNERTEHLKDVIETLKKTQDKLIKYERIAVTSNMIAGMAHQINTPLGVAITASTFLESQIQNRDAIKDSTRLEKAIELVVSSLKKASDLIEAYKQLSVKQFIEGKRTFNLRSIIDTTIWSMRKYLEENRILVHILCSENIQLHSFPGVFSLVFENLVNNSIFHGFKETEEKLISISVNSDYMGLYVTFSDNGCGIDEEELAKIFEPFYSTGSGTGIGLNVIHNLIMQKLNGEVKCSSVGGLGTTFIITLPTSLIFESSANLSDE